MKLEMASAPTRLLAMWLGPEAAVGLNAIGRAALRRSLTEISWSYAASS